MNEREKYFIDLSKCSDEQRKHIFSLLPNPKFDYQHDITEEDFKLHLSGYSWWVLNNYEVKGKTELTYPEFIKLFDGGETIKSDNTQTLQNALQQIEKLEAEKKELLEALEKVEKWGGEFGMDYQIYKEIESLIQKYK